MENKPILIEDSYIIWKAFCDLDDTRQSSGFAPCRISFPEMETWCNSRFIPFIERETFFSMIMKLDRIRIKDIEKKIEADIERKKRERRGKK